MNRAPETPTTQELHTSYPLSLEAELAVRQMRDTVSHALDNSETHTVGIIGYCARPGIAYAADIMRESSLIAGLHEPQNGLITLHRGPMWKPRSNPDDWHGEETKDPAGAYQTLRDQAERHANVAVEIGQDYHLQRYGHLLSFIWTGGRSIANTELIKAAALEDPTIPLGIKNDLDGTIDTALERVAYASELRGPEGAPVVLLYRGGHTVDTPSAWEEAVIEAHERTDGRFILDTAHGSEMAHDPAGNFGKSIDGQVLAVHSMNRLVRQGYAPAGSMMEASDLDSRTDPHMPLAIALTGLQAQHHAKVRQHWPLERVLQESA